jgi:hypothetical protein
MEVCFTVIEAGKFKVKRPLLVRAFLLHHNMAKGITWQEGAGDQTCNL